MADEPRCASCENIRKPVRYKEAGEWFCSKACLQAWWVQRAREQAERKGLCPDCWAVHLPGTPCVGWVVKKKTKR